MKILMVLLLVALFSACGVEPDYYTNHGMAVTVGEVNNPGPRTVEFWTDETIMFWRGPYPQWTQCMYSVTGNVHVFFVDEDHVLNEDGDQFAGLAYSDLTIEISNGGPIKVRGVFIHELSHIYAGECGDVWSNNGSHAIFKEVGLPTVANKLGQNLLIF